MSRVWTFPSLCPSTGIEWNQKNVSQWYCSSSPKCVCPDSSSLVLTCCPNSSLTPIHFRWRRNIHTSTPVDLSLFLWFTRAAEFLHVAADIQQYIRQKRECVSVQTQLCVYSFLSVFAETFHRKKSYLKQHKSRNDSSIMLPLIPIWSSSGRMLFKY